jgi:hypothetical protein
VVEGVACLALLWAGTALAKTTPQQTCEAGKDQQLGVYASCLQMADKNKVLTGDTTKYNTAVGKCDATLATNWAKLEKKGSCPTTGDESTVQSTVTDFTSCESDNLAGEPPAICDPTTLQSNLSTCETNLTSCLASSLAPLLQTGQTTSYGPGSDGDLQEGVVRSYTDNGDGTITDNKTGLMWEKKDQSGGIHDWGNTYTWSGASYGSTNVMDGTITTTFLAALNAGAGFAGHTDWRIPNRFELESIVNLQNFTPSVDTVFNTSCAASCTVLTCSCTQSNNYWSSSTYQYFPDEVAWLVDFLGGFVDSSPKAGSVYYVRAVRGGS